MRPRDAGTFHVQRRWDDTLRQEVELTKTHGSNAVLNFTPIATEVAAELTRTGERDPADWRRSPLLFTRPDGRPISTDYFLRKWHQAMAQVPDIAYRPPKNLRDTFATLTLLELGVDKIKIVADLMRHAQPAPPNAPTSRRCKRCAAAPPRRPPPACPATPTSPARPAPWRRQTRKRRACLATATAPTRGRRTTRRPR